METVAKSFGFASTEAALFAKKLHDVTAEFGDNLSYSKKMAKATAMAEKEMWESFNATQRFSRSLEQLWNNIKLITSGFLSFIGIALTPMIRWLSWATGGIAKFSNWLVVLYDQLRNSPLGPVVELLEDTVGLFLALGFVIGGVILIWKAWKAAVAAHTIVMGIAATVTSTAATATTAAGTAAATATPLLGGFGAALGAFGTKAAPAIGILLAIGAALLMAGAGAYF